MSTYTAKMLPALAFMPTSPAKLASIPTIEVVLSGGSGGSVAVYLLHYNDRIGAWSSIAGVAGEGTLLGTITATATLTPGTIPVGPNEQVLLWLVFDDTSGTPPTIVSASIAWTSDITAPDAPTISKITSVAPDEDHAGYRADFGDIPTGARHIIVEGQLNGGDWLPFSKRAKFEAESAGFGHMEFLGALDTIEAAGTRNERHISVEQGIALGDVAKIRAAAEDASGNRSAFTTSDALTIAGQTYVPVPTDDYEIEIDDENEIEVTVDE